MKKMAASILFLTLILSACQATPEESYVAEKNAEKFQEAIQNTAAPAEGTVSTDEPEQKYEITEYQDFFPGADSNVRVNIDAEVFNRSGPYPVIRIKPHEFTSKEVEQWAGVLFQGNTAYEPQIELSKSEIEAEILRIRQYIGDEDALAEYYGYDAATIEEIKEMYAEQLTFYEEKLQNASEKVTKKETDWQFRTENYYDYMAEVSWEEEELLELDQTEKLIVEAEVDGYQAQIQVRNRNAEDYMLHHFLYTVEDSCQSTPLEQSEEEVIDQVQDTLEQLGWNNWKNISCRYIHEQSQGINGEDQYYYTLSYTPVYEGMDVTFQMQLSSIKREDNYAALYYYEALNIRFSNNRIISLDWNSPMDVVAVENENVSILTLEEALNLFQTQMQIEATADRLGTGDGSTAKQIEARVDNIELGLVRIRIPDNEREFYLVPAWTFTGEIGRDYGGGVSFYSESFQDVLLNEREFVSTYQTINAVDGTFINVSKGY